MNTAQRCICLAYKRYHGCTTAQPFGLCYRSLPSAWWCKPSRYHLL
ncbi:hypothetical protein F5984_07415 [Rudanella paleaurantiibacter]|uniref:Uncharacterized protein n=1 Tax=Rudanella paleaurantiibacter TaxID=2614655 RepID=A0A7J5U3N8_9BACT|nr:hypothetical protein F5984_07415 [Rudanella paleaurantiibacter]